MSETSPAIGIDLGTTYCCAAFLASDNRVHIIDNELGEPLTPSYVAFTDEGEVFGKPAQDLIFTNPENVLYDSKRLMGRKFSDAYLQENLKNWSFKVAAVNATDDDSPLMVIERDREPYARFRPHEISAKLLAHVKTMAEKRLGCKIKDVVITVPAHFNYHQRTATEQAGKMAGLNVVKIINEPTAAILAYVHKNEVRNAKNALVFDLGGGTLDVSVVTVRKGSVTVLAASGNTHLGGRDFDNNLAQLIAKKVKTLYNTDVTEKKATMQRIHAVSEGVKTKLTFQSTASCDISSVLYGEDIEVDRAGFEKINSNLFDLCIQTVENCLKDAQLTKNDIEKVLLVGGSTRIPKLQQTLTDFFDNQNIITQAINPDEAVVYGAAVQAAMFNQEEPTPKITDVTPLSLGVASFGNLMDVVIPRNTPIPVTKTVNRVTIFDGQEDMGFNIYEGERPLVKYNTKIGTSTVGFPPKPPGYSVDLTLHVNDNGILEISAKTDSGVYRTLTIDYEKNSPQTASDIIQDAVVNEASDGKKKELIAEWAKLHYYCTKMNYICNFDKKYLREKEKTTIRNAAKVIADWASSIEVEDGDENVKEAVLSRQKELEEVCEPILNKYGYKVKNLGMWDFYKLITRKQ